MQPAMIEKISPRTRFFPTVWRDAADMIMAKTIKATPANRSDGLPFGVST